MRKAVVWGVGVALVATLASGCTDLSGEVDDLGHNGYDMETCEEFKSLAMDVEHNSAEMTPGSPRVKSLLKISTKTSDTAIRQGVLAFVQAHESGNADAAKTATTSLLSACEFQSNQN